VTRTRTAVDFSTGFVLMMAAGWILFPRLLYERREQPIDFSHAAHAETAGIACEDCHAIHADGRFAGIPAASKCAECHQEAIGTTAAEKTLVEEYISKAREIPWLSYARQPDNTYFSHAGHVRLAQVPCESCHGPHGSSASLRPAIVNRLSGYGQDIWGASMTRLGMAPWEGHKMTDCSSCHLERGVEESCLDCHK
jgi:hypothetical protein